MSKKEKTLGKSGLIIIGTIIGIMLIVSVVGYIGSRISNSKQSNDIQNPLTSVGPEQNEKAPDFSLPSINNNIIKLSDYRGKVVFLNFWATWCPPCRMELPSIERLSQKLKGLPFVVLAVNVDETNIQSIKQFAQDMGLTFTVLVDNNTVSSMYRINALPTTLIIKKDGTIYAIVSGARAWDEQGYVDDFKKLISER
ncbi:MAG: TlpA family protein disulfide reductase [Deltaproteobacteria bacterium]|nr:TlpA family protein disulfide reductase [Deltaproteobacteria bacterium]MCL5792651.1 TlpA family protein disulfide reductase [Deltaproteobacteria bacterium]